MKVGELRSALDYDPGTGLFRWKVSNNKRIRVGQQAGTEDAKGYIAIKHNNVSYRAHRLAWLYVYGDTPFGEIDHINGVRSDNRIENLRVVSSRENSRNSRLRYDNRSGIHGVFYYKPVDRWLARITVDGEPLHLGSFHCLLDAAAARKSAEIKHNFHINHGVKA